MANITQKLKDGKRSLLCEYFEKNQSEFETLFQGNKDPIFVQDLDGYVVRVNPAFEELFQYTNEEMQQWKIQKHIPINSLDKILNYFEKAILGRYENFDCEMNNKNGELLTLNLTNIPISVENQIVGVYTVAKNITQIKKLKKEIREIVEFHSFLTNNILDMVTNTNLQGTVLYVSPSCERILGFTVDELLGSNLFNILHPDDRERAAEERKKTITECVNGRDIYRFRKKDGDYIWVESLCKPVVDQETNNIVEFVSVARDITEQIEMEKELKRQQNAYRSLIKNSPDVMLIVNKEGNIIFINETGLNLLGVSNESEMIGKSAYEILHPDFHQKAAERTKKVSNGEIVELSDYKLVRKDGTIIDAEIKTIQTIFQNTVAYQIFIRDLTPRKKANELLIQSEKLSTVGQLAAGIAHEVRNPLTAIKGFLRLMETQNANKTYFDIINSEMNRIELILSELLVLGKPKVSKRANENLKVLIEDIILLIGTQAIMNNVELRLAEFDYFIIHCDRNQMKQVFINLLKNSIEAMKNGGQIVIEVNKQGHDRVRILIKDNGPGIPEHILKRIGEPFFTTKENGTGLGLMICKQIIENHNGTINFLSNHYGTMVEITLPI